LKKLIVILLGILIIFSFFYFDLNQYLNFNALKEKKDLLKSFYAENVFLTILFYFILYLVVAALALPGAAIMTMAGGAIFGLVQGSIIVSIASTSGAALAFVVTRYLVKDIVQKKYGEKLKDINNGLEKEGLFYLFTLRLIPVVPFFLINLGFSLTPMRLFSFFWVSQIGMIPGTILYVNAGTQLSQIDSPAGILSPSIILSFVILGLFPLVMKKIVSIWKNNKLYKAYNKPKRFDYNVAVIGAGSGGLVSSYIAAAVKAKTLLIEKHKMGGDCLNTGCVPSKAFIKSAKVLHQTKRAEEWGINSANVDFDFKNIMERVQNVIKKVEPHDSVERYTNLGVDIKLGSAMITSPYDIQVGDESVTAKNIIIATGASPSVPPIPGIDLVNPFTSDTIWNLRELPKRLVVVGGGPIGSELAQSFSRFGSKVTIIEAYPCILSREDDDVSNFMCEVFEKEGVDILKSHRVVEFKMIDGKKTVVCKSGNNIKNIEADEILLALGRKANVKGFGLEELDVKITGNGTIEVDDFLRTNYQNIYAVGDVAGPYQFTHFASHQAWYASVNSLFSPFKKFKTDYRVIPRTTFTDPEVARVGLNENEALEKNIEYEVVNYDISELDRAIAEGEDRGFIKVLVSPGKDTVLGATIVGHHAGELITEFVTAMKHNFGLNKILGTIHAYPTFSEANKSLAGNWKKSHAPEGALKWLKKYHAWRRN
jgi:dihydrolipoamide dehydrogenase